MRTYRLYQIDSFTREKFTGNPAGVITNAEGLTDTEMQHIAREMNNSETAFVFLADSGEYDVHVRFFTATREVPICGHATIAAHYARALENGLGSGRVLQKTGAGILPIDIVKDGGDFRIVMTQGRIEFGAVLEGAERVLLARALGISEGDLLENHPIQIVSTGHSKVMTGIRSRELLDRLKPDMGLLADLSGRIGCNGFYVYTMDPEDAEILIQGRMFAPAIGINEDPVTGNANGPLGAYLVHHRLVPHNGSLFRFRIMQGEAIGRAGVMDVDVGIEGGEPTVVRISGNAVVVFRTDLVL